MQTKRPYQISEEWQNDSRISTRNVSRSVRGKAQVGQKWTGLEKSGQSLEGLQRYLGKTIAKTHQRPGMFVRRFKNE